MSFNVRPGYFVPLPSTGARMNQDGKSTAYLSPPSVTPAVPSQLPCVGHSDGYGTSGGW
jgi:hypothetical protein